MSFLGKLFGSRPTPQSQLSTTYEVALTFLILSNQKFLSMSFDTLMEDLDSNL
jgi:hypothetical protein